MERGEETRRSIRVYKPRDGAVQRRGSADRPDPLSVCYGRRHRPSRGGVEDGLSSPALRGRGFPLAGLLPGQAGGGGTARRPSRRPAWQAGGGRVGWQWTPGRSPPPPLPRCSATAAVWRGEGGGQGSARPRTLAAPPPPHLARLHDCLALNDESVPTINMTPVALESLSTSCYYDDYNKNNLNQLLVKIERDKHRGGDGRQVGRGRGAAATFRRPDDASPRQDLIPAPSLVWRGGSCT